MTTEKPFMTCCEAPSSAMELESALHELKMLNRVDYYSEKFSKKELRRADHCAMSSRSMELDSALHELGMLSTVTNSRLSYLEEKTKKKRSSNSLSSAPLKCFVQMKPTVIENFSISKKSSTSGESESDDEITLERSTCDFAVRRCWKRTVRRDSPYFIRKRMAARDLVNTVSPPPLEKASPPSVSRQDSGNKSNPSSPVKSQSSLTNQGSSITRSRSLDDLEILDFTQDFFSPPIVTSAVRTDIDTVSQSISQLHVS